MSYIRSGSVYRHVDGISMDYVYPTSERKVDAESNADTETSIVVHGSGGKGRLTPHTIVEFVARLVREPSYKDDKEFGEFVIRAVASALNVRLRGEELSPQEAADLSPYLLVAGDKEWREWEEAKRDEK